MHFKCPILSYDASERSNICPVALKKIQRMNVQPSFSLVFRSMAWIQQGGLILLSASSLYLYIFCSPDTQQKNSELGRQVQQIPIRDLSVAQADMPF